MNKYQIILASKSPRRQQLLQGIGINFVVKTKDVDEQFPPELVAQEIPLFLCQHKAASFENELQNADTIVVTADTIVWIENQVLNKPENFEEAEKMLQLLSGKTHEVYTAVCIKSQSKTRTFYSTSSVTFNLLSQKEIEDYINVYTPFDKAGSYGAQDALPIGYNPCSKQEIEFLKSLNKLELIENTVTVPTKGERIALINKIEGSYFNVMGLPLVEIYEEIQRF